MITTNPTDPIYGPIRLPEVTISAPKKRGFWEQFNLDRRQRQQELAKSPSGALWAPFETLLELPQAAMSYYLTSPMVSSQNRSTLVDKSLGIEDPYLALGATILLDPMNFAAGPFKAPTALRRGTDVSKWSRVMLTPLKGGVDPNNYRQFAGPLSKQTKKEYARLQQRLASSRNFLKQTAPNYQTDAPLMIEMPGMQGGIYTLVGGTPMVAVGSKEPALAKARMVARGLGHALEDATDIGTQFSSHLRTSLQIDPQASRLANTLYALYDELPSFAQSPQYKNAVDAVLRRRLDETLSGIVQGGKLPYGVDATAMKDLDRLARARNYEEASGILRSSPNLQGLLDLSEFLSAQKAYPMFRETFPVMDDPLRKYLFFRSKPFNPQALKSDKEFLKEVQRLKLDKRLPMYRFIEPTSRNLKELRGFLEDLP